MSTVTLQIPEIILEAHQHNLETVRKELQRGLIIWEYLNGRLSLSESGEVLQIGYRGFLELLWSKGIPIDGLSKEELEQQRSQLRTVLETQRKWSQILAR